MAARRSASLARRFPRRLDVPFFLVVSGAMLCLGLMLPAMQTRTAFFWRDEYSIYMNVVRMSREGRELAATILAVCSIAYPLGKLAILVYFWLMPFPDRWRSGIIRLLRLLGRWSMVDVFAVSAIILASMTIGPMDATPKIGLYLYAGGILMLMFTALLMDRLARRGR
jgi:uncharacterized paraquat-inducible protein A